MAMTEKKNLKKENSLPQEPNTEDFDRLYDLALKHFAADPVKALDYTQKAHEIARKMDTLPQLGMAWYLMGALNVRLGQAQKAIPYLKKAIGAMAELGDSLKQARARGNLASAYSVMSQSDQALRQYKLLIADFAKLGDHSSVAKTYYNIGSMNLKRNEFAEAIQNLNQALTLYKRHPDPEMEIESWCLVGYVYYRLLDYEKYIQCLQKARQIAETTKDQISLANMHSHLGAAYVILKQNDRAEEHYGTSLKLARKMKISHLVALCLSNLADIKSSQDKFDIALRYAQEALELDQKTDNTNYLAQDYYVLGSIQHRIENFGEAERCLDKCLKISRKNDLEEVYVCAVKLLVRNYTFQKRFAKAEKLLAPLLETVGAEPVNELQLDVLEVAAFLYSSMGDFERSNRYLTQYHDITQEYITQESQRRAQYLQISFETAQKEKEKRLLALQNRLLEKRVKEEVAKHREKDRLLAEQENMALLGRVTAGIAHELNNPLAAIKQAVEITLQSLENGRKGTLYLAEKQTDIYNMLNRINRLVEIVKVISHSPDRFTNRPFQVNDIIAEFTDLFADRVLEKDTVLITRLAARLPFVNGDGIRFLQVVSILVGNASDALSIVKEGVKKISVKTSLSGGKVVVEISDNGPGMTPEQLMQIKQPFYSTKDVDKGMGMGLPIATSIIANMKGTLEIASQKGAGTTVTLALPALEEGGER